MLNNRRQGVAAGLRQRIAEGLCLGTSRRVARIEDNAAAGGGGGQQRAYEIKRKCASLF